VFEITHFLFNGILSFLSKFVFSVTNAYISERSLCCAVVKVSLEVSAASRGMWLHIRGSKVLLIGRYVCGAGSFL